MNALTFFNFLFIIIILFFSIIIFYPMNRYKTMKTKEDQLFLQKTLITTIFFALILLINIFLLLKIFEETRIYFIAEIIGFNIYILIIQLYNFFLSYELYSTYMNPVHYFNRLFKQKKYNYIFELIILIFAIVCLSIDVVLFNCHIYDNFEENKISIGEKDETDNKNYYVNDSSLFIIMHQWKSIFLILFSLISLILCFRTKYLIKKFCFKKQDKCSNFISKRILSNVLYLIYGIFYTLPLITKADISEIYNIFGSIFFFLILINDFLIHFSIIASSKFCEYRLKKTLLGYFCSFLIKTPKDKISDNNSDNDSNIFDGFSRYHNDSSSLYDLVPNCPSDKELISIYKNQIFMEDYFMHFFDQILNITVASISKVYESQYFSVQANEQRLKVDIKIEGDISSITGQKINNTNSNTNSTLVNNNIFSTKNEIGDENISFDFNKNINVDEYDIFKDVLEKGMTVEKNNNYLLINIKSFYTNRCVESIYDQKLKGKTIANSISSHMNLSGSNKKLNEENPLKPYYSLFAANGKEQYYNKLKNTNIKTYDKMFNLDIFDTSDNELNKIQADNNTNLEILLDKYFTYVHGKGINGTFIPSLVGVFKIQINSFKTLLVFVSRNSLVENVPKNFFTYWQLVRFLDIKPQKLSSSQYTHGTLVKDESIFERSLHFPTEKENPDFNKIVLKNFLDFQDIIQSDIKFLNQIGAQNFDLLLMYYEYENVKKHEKDGVIKINNSGEIIEENAPKNILFNDIGSPIEQNLEKDIPMTNTFFSPMDRFLDDEIINDKNEAPKNMAKIIDTKEKIDINGYDGVFNSFSCLCFFSFENVFDVRPRLTLAKNYYNNFQDKILTNFTNFKKNVYN